MPRKGKRRTITTGIYQDSGGYEVRVVVGGVPYGDRMPKDSTLEELKKKRAQLENRGRTQTPRTERGTLAADAKRYIKLNKHLASWDDREDHLDAWITRLGNVPRHRITSADVMAARVFWLGLDTPPAPKTINHRVGTLRNLYRTLDGKRESTPCDDIDPLHVPKTPIQRVSDALILAVDAKLQEGEANGTLRDAKTRARFRVMVSTGKRPCELMRAKPSDVNLEVRVWIPRDAKGGFSAGAYLNDDQLAAWKLFIEADAWGPYNHGNFSRVIRTAGWPAGVRAYNARHTTWITARERGVPLEDVADGAGHKDTKLTKLFYTGVLNGPLQAMSERLDGRFQGWPVVPVSAPDRKSQRTKGVR
jgi:integrase